MNKNVEFVLETVIKGLVFALIGYSVFLSPGVAITISILSVISTGAHLENVEPYTYANPNRGIVDAVGNDAMISMLVCIATAISFSELHPFGIDLPYHSILIFASFLAVMIFLFIFFTGKKEFLLQLTAFLATIGIQLVVVYLFPRDTLFILLNSFNLLVSILVALAIYGLYWFILFKMLDYFDSIN